MDWVELSWPAANFPLSTTSVGIIAVKKMQVDQCHLQSTHHLCSWWRIVCPQPLFFICSNQATLALFFLWREIFGRVPLSAYAELSSWDPSSDLTLTEITHVFPFLCFLMWRQNQNRGCRKVASLTLPSFAQLPCDIMAGFTWLIKFLGDKLLYGHIPDPFPQGLATRDYSLPILDLTCLRWVWTTIPGISQGLLATHGIVLWGIGLVLANLDMNSILDHRHEMNDWWNALVSEGASVSSQPAFWWLLVLCLKLAVICMGFFKE